jgi:hypothetical protein
MANISNYKVLGMNYITSLKVPSDDAPKPPGLQDLDQGFLAMNLQSGRVTFRPETAKDLTFNPIRDYVNVNQDYVNFKLKRMSF